MGFRVQDSVLARGHVISSGPNGKEIVMRKWSWYSLSAHLDGRGTGQEPGLPGGSYDYGS
jgi:hypothetical protein